MTICGVCGAAARPPFRAPPPELAPDLDLRPGEPTRSTLRRWVAVCGGCGAAAPDLAAVPGAARMVVDSAAYRALSGPAAPFLRWAMLCAAVGERDEEAAAVLQGAWALDDAEPEGAGEDAAALRVRAAGLLGEGTTMQEGLQAVDALRRAGRMDAAGAQAARMLALRGVTDTDRLVLAYQRQLCAAGDAGRHLMSAALRPPAQRPHAAQGRPSPRGFWQRLWQPLAGR